MSRRIVLASGNAHKIAEFQAMLASVPGWEVVALGEATSAMEPWEESGDTFVANAQIKAHHVYQHRLHESDYVLADDSGLCVAALAGRPGVFSARYAGPQAGDDENNQKLLQELAAVPESQRQATFVCVLVLMTPDGDELVFQGECPGVILPNLQGKNGFGYDPLFFLPTLGKTFAELPPEEKAQVSHRSVAVAALCRYLSGLG